MEHRQSKAISGEKQCVQIVQFCPMVVHWQVIDRKLEWSGWQWWLCHLLKNKADIKSFTMKKSLCSYQKCVCEQFCCRWWEPWALPKLLMEMLVGSMPTQWRLQLALAEKGKDPSLVGGACPRMLVSKEAFCYSYKINVWIKTLFASGVMHILTFTLSGSHKIRNSGQT